jgi:hypothetical protein
MRRADWEQRLADWTYEAERASWEWGFWDCVHCAARWVWMATGRDVLAPLGLSYTTAGGALLEIGRRGGMAAAITRAMGEPLDEVGLAQRGDLVLVRAGRHECLGVCVGQAALVPMGLGAQRVAPGDWLTAWRVD